MFRSNNIQMIYKKKSILKYMGYFFYEDQWIQRWQKNSGSVVYSTYAVQCTCMFSKSVFLIKCTK